MKFKINKQKLAKTLAAEVIGLKTGIPFAGLTTTLTIDAISNLLSNTAEIKLHERPLQASDEFLNQHPLSIQGLYDREPLLGGRLLYVEMVNFADCLLQSGQVDIRISLRKGLFSLRAFPDADVEALREQGFNRLREAKKYTHPSDVIRLWHVKTEGTSTIMEIQKAHYEHQAKSNLILDFCPNGQTTIRQALGRETPGRLPALDDDRLANTLGVTILVFYRDEQGVFCPFLVPRTRKVAVLNRGQWSDSASGAAEWPKDPENTAATFEDYILDDLYKELSEEIGLRSSDLSALYPLALCRDVIREGKPQLFFVGFTELTRKQMIEKMEEARKLNKKNPIEPEEIFRMPLLRKPPVFSSSADANKTYEEKGVDPQCAASLYYAMDFLSKLGEDPEFQL